MSKKAKTDTLKVSTTSAVYLKAQAVAGAEDNVESMQAELVEAIRFSFGRAKTIQFAVWEEHRVNIGAGYDSEKTKTSGFTDGARQLTSRVKRQLVELGYTFKEKAKSTSKDAIKKAKAREQKKADLAKTIEQVEKLADKEGIDTFQAASQLHAQAKDSQEKAAYLQVPSAIVKRDASDLKAKRKELREWSTEASLEELTDVLEYING